MAITVTFVALGYMGAAATYSYLIGLNIDSRFLCPVCPEIISFGPPTEKFIRRTIVLGTVNAAVVASAGWLLIGIAFGLRNLFPSRSR